MARGEVVARLMLCLYLSIDKYREKCVGLIYLVQSSSAFVFVIYCKFRISRLIQLIFDVFRFISLFFSNDFFVVFYQFVCNPI